MNCIILSSVAAWPDYIMAAWPHNMAAWPIITWQHDIIITWQHDLILTWQHDLVSWTSVTFLCPAPSIVVVILDPETILFMTSGQQRLRIDTDMTLCLLLWINQRTRPFTTKYLTFLQETIRYYPWHTCIFANKITDQSLSLSLSLSETVYPSSFIYKKMVHSGN